MRFVLAPCSVQGPSAADEIAEAIRLINQRADCDVVLCGRGGGSLEDLWPFNEEKVARAIRSSRVPVVSCVGHETDFTIADFAADARAATPSNAAEIAIPERREYIGEIAELSMALDKSLMQRISFAQAELKSLLSSYALRDPASAWVAPRRRELSELTRRLDSAMRHRIDSEKAALSVLRAKVDSLRPGAPLERGYALIERAGSPVESADALKQGDKISIWMKDGGFTAALGERMEGSAWEHAKEKGTNV